MSLARGMLTLLGFLPLSAIATSAQQQTIIGVLDGPEEYLFGWISDVAVGPNGEVVTLDEQMGLLRLYRSDGSYVGQVGRPGQGPGEYEAPQGIAINEDGLLAVVDAGNIRLNLYRVGPDGAGFVTSERIRHGFQSVCWIGDRIFASNRVSGPLITEFASDGREVRSFGERLGAPRELARELRGNVAHLNEGSLACDQQSGRIAFVSRRLGAVHTWNTEGELLWQATPSTWVLVQMSWIESMSACCQFGIPADEEFYHEARAIAFRNGEVIVSAERVPSGTVSDAFSFEATNGRFLFVKPTESFLFHSTTTVTGSFQVRPVSRVLLDRVNR